MPVNTYCFLSFLLRSNTVFELIFKVVYKAILLIIFIDEPIEHINIAVIPYMKVFSDKINI